MTIEVDLSNPASYYFFNVPVPIARARDLTRLDACVWGTFHASETINADSPHVGSDGVHLSINQVASWVGANRQTTRRSIQKLVELGYLVRTGRAKPNPIERGSLCFRTFIPERVRDVRFVKKGLLRGVKLDGKDAKEVDEDLNTCPGGGSTPGSNRPGGDGSIEPGGTGRFDPGGTGRLNPGGRVDSTRLYKSKEEGKEEEEEEGVQRASRERDAPAGVETTDEAEDGSPPSDPETLRSPDSHPREVEEIDPNSESRAALEKIESDAQDRRERAKRRPRRKVLASPASDPAVPASERPELNRWRARPDVRAWSARDVVGYFACRFRETRGEESPEFRATTDHIFRRLASNVSKFTKNWLEGDPTRARDIADRILERAEERGLPVKLGYYFTPANGATVLRLDEPARRGRPETPAERNDRRGADTPENQRYFAELQERLEREEEERERANAKVHRDDRLSA